MVIRVSGFLFRVDPDQLVACQSGLRLVSVLPENFAGPARVGVWLCRWLL